MRDLGIDLPPSARTALDSLSTVSGKWHPVVIAVLLHRGPMGFNALLEAIPDVSGKVLSGTLSSLQEAGLVDRTEVNESPLRVEYALTDAGAEMKPVFDALAAWGDVHLESVTPTVLVADADRRITEMYASWLRERYTVVRAHTDEELATRLDGPVDVVLYDHGIWGVTPGTLFERLGETCRIVALVGDRPDFDLLAAPVDDLRRKPIVRETVVDAVETQLDRTGEPPDRRERASLSARRSLFESIYPRERLDAVEAYRELRSRLQELGDRTPE